VPFVADSQLTQSLARAEDPRLQLPIRQEKGFWNDFPVFLHLLSGISGPHAPMLERDPFTFPDTCVDSLRFLA
jgi:hypothetical protein